MHPESTHDPPGCEILPKKKKKLTVINSLINDLSCSYVYDKGDPNNRTHFAMSGSHFFVFSYRPGAKVYKFSLIRYKQL